MKYVLGTQATDKITGFTGILTGFAKYITGCDQYLLQPKGSSGNYPKGEWVDENRLTVGDKVLVSINTGQDKGACGIAPIK